MSTALPWHLQKLPHDPHWDVGPGWDLGRARGFQALAKDGLNPPHGVHCACLAPQLYWHSCHQHHLFRDKHLFCSHNTFHPLPHRGVGDSDPSPTDLPEEPREGVQPPPLTAYWNFSLYSRALARTRRSSSTTQRPVTPMHPETPCTCSQTAPKS